MVYCKVFKGNVPINDALVELTISLADHFVMKNKVERFLLLDNGSEPDVTKNDGIYTKYLHLKEKGVYKLDIVASSNGDIAYTQSAGKQKQHDSSDISSRFMFLLLIQLNPINERIPST